MRHGSDAAPGQARSAPELRTWMLYPLFFAAVYFSHLTLLRLPYFWDEAGYYIPAALDFFRTGTLVPRSTLTNAHPPLPSILLAGWWHLSGFVPSGTRTLVCLVSAAALLGVFRMCRRMTGDLTAGTVALLTAAYPVWYAQSTLAHSDIFAAAFTLWALSFYFPGRGEGEQQRGDVGRMTAVALLFSLGALSKETAIVTPAALATLELVLAFRQRSLRRDHFRWFAALASPVLPLAAWYAFHYSRTGFVFGNPEFLRYNATANLSAYRIALCLWHRLLHLAMHMNMFVPTTSALGLALLGSRAKPADGDAKLPRETTLRIGVILAANWIAFSVLGGALLTRYLLPMYPLVLLLCAVAWRRTVTRWWIPAAVSFAAFVLGIFVNPPYAFAPEDNLTYREMITLHQQAVRVIENRFPSATVLTAWPASAELERPDLGYSRAPIKTTEVRNFSAEEVAKAAAEPGAYDTALVFSTKWAPAAGNRDLGKRNESQDVRYFDFHRDLLPGEIAARLHGDVVWQARRKGEWAAVIHFPRIVNASISPLAP